jgi:two-component system, NarL family, invasion response regulator UvrY
VISILICDDHPVVRRGLKEILASGCSVKCVGEASTAQEALKQAQQRRWDVILLDITLPGMGGLETLKQLKRDQPRLPVLMVSMHPEDQYAVRTLRAGASGYLTKETVPDELVKAVHCVLRGRKYVTPHVAEQLIHEIENPSSDRQAHEVLSDREYQVTCLIAAGKTVKEIARNLSLSVKTVSTYRTRSLEKLGGKSTADIVRYAIEHGLTGVAGIVRYAIEHGLAGAALSSHTG